MISRDRRRLKFHRIEKEVLKYTRREKSVYSISVMIDFLNGVFQDAPRPRRLIKIAEQAAIKICISQDVRRFYICLEIVGMCTLSPIRIVITCIHAKQLQITISRVLAEETNKKKFINREKAWRNNKFPHFKIHDTKRCISRRYFYRFNWNENFQ